MLITYNTIVSQNLREVHSCPWLAPSSSKVGDAVGVSCWCLGHHRIACSLVEEDPWKPAEAKWRRYWTLLRFISEYDIFPPEFHWAAVAPLETNPVCDGSRMMGVKEPFRFSREREPQLRYRYIVTMLSVVWNYWKGFYISRQTHTHRIGWENHLHWNRSEACKGRKFIRTHL